MSVGARLQQGRGQATMAGERVPLVHGQRNVLPVQSGPVSVHLHRHARRTGMSLTGQPSEGVEGLQPVAALIELQGLVEGLFRCDGHGSVMGSRAGNGCLRTPYHHACQCQYPGAKGGAACTGARRAAV